MKLIKQSFEILEQKDFSLIGIKKFIERCGRVSHKSEDRITEDSAETFVEKMMKMKHLSTCEFGTVYLYIDYHNPSFGKIIDKYNNNKYSKLIIDDLFPNKAYITTNYRVLIENNWLDDLKYLCEPTEYHHKRYTVKFICDRAILAEFTRHRKFSFMAESTRYCNYSKDKFGNELTFIIPCWVEEKQENMSLEIRDIWGNNYAELCSKEILARVERAYFTLIKEGWKPEQARNVLPLCLKTELYMCGFAEDWEKFFELRTASNAHPQARELAIPLQERFKELGYVNQ